jgi:DNA recombination protein RmuC
MDYMIALIVGLLLGVLLYWLLSRRKPGEVKTEMRDAFESLARQSLKDNANMFLDRTKSELEPLNQSLEKLDDRIRELEQKREGAYQGLQEQITGLSQAHSALHETTLTLSQALRSSSVRGRWGELQLRRVVELAGLMDHIDFEEQPSTDSGRPDLVVHLPSGGALPVDAKAPMKAYLDAVEENDEERRVQRLEDHAKALRARVRTLSRKQYWEQFECTPQCVVMFVPNEACLSAAFQQDGGLLEYAMQSQILIASPVTLLGLLKAVGYGWQQVSLAENARQIAEEGRVLYRRLGRVIEHMDSLGTNLGRAVGSFNALVGSLEYRLLPSARRFRELGVDAAELPGVDRIDQGARRPDVEEIH